MLLELGHFVNCCDMNSLTESQLKNKILEIFVDRYQITRLKKYEVVKVIQLMLVGLRYSSEMIVKKYSEDLEEQVNMEKIVRVMIRCLYYRDIMQKYEEIRRGMADLTWKALKQFYHSIGYQSEEVSEILEKVLDDAGDLNDFPKRLFSHLI